MQRIAWRVAPLFLILSQGLHAHCGLNFCPRDAEVAGNSFEASIAAHQTGFDLNGHGGQYTELEPGFLYTHNGQLLLGASLAVAGLDVEGDTKWGMENPLLFGEWRFHPGMGNMIALGSQLELPFGDEDDGIGTDHMMLVPYVTLGKGMDPWFVTANLGFRTVIFHEEEAVDSTATYPFLYVHPHEDQELLYRASAGMSLSGGFVKPEIFLSGQHVLVDEKENVTDDDDLSAGILAPFEAKPLVIVPMAEFPILSTGRFDWRFGVDFRWKF